MNQKLLNKLKEHFDHYVEIIQRRVEDGSYLDQYDKQLELVCEMTANSFDDMEIVWEVRHLGGEYNSLRVRGEDFDKVVMEAIKQIDEWIQYLKNAER